MSGLLRSQIAAAAISAVFLLATFAVAQAELPLSPWIFGHRGAAGTLPEHTLEGYQMGIAQGAHFVECDVVLTKDCKPICRHEPDVSGTTDALHKFPHYLRNATVDGTEIRGIFTTDLTLSQIKTLRAKERLATRVNNSDYNFFYQIPTLQEYIDVVKAADHVVGVVPETKHPSWFSQQGLPCLEGTNISAILLDVLRENGYDNEFNSTEWRKAPAIIQSFEQKNLQWLAESTGIALLQLLDESDYDVPYTDSTYADLMTDSGLENIATYATFLGPWKESFAPADGSVPSSANLSSRAHAQGLLVTPYTFRNDDPWNVTEQAEGAPEEDIRYFLEVQHIDGAFTDFAGTFAYVLRNLHDNTSTPAQPLAPGQSSR